MGKYLIRTAFVALILMTILIVILFYWPRANKDQKWRYFRIGHVALSGQVVSSGLAFARAAATTSDIDNLAMLPGGLAYLPKKALPIFGQTAAKSDAVADAVLEPESCLFVRSIQLETAPSAGGAAGHTLVIINEKSRSTNLSAKIRALLPERCATTTSPECEILIWAEGRRKKCD